MTESFNNKLSEFFSNRPTQRLGTGQPILKPGDNVLKAYYVLEGYVVQHDISSAGNIVIVGTYTTGSIIPLPNIFSKRPANFFYEAGSPLLIKQSSVDNFLGFVDSDPSMLAALLKSSYATQESSLKKVAYLMGGSATSRLIYELVTASLEFGDVGSDGSIFIPFSQSDLSKRTGLARETINRIIQNLKKLGKISPSHNGISIPDFKQLEQLLED